MLHRGSNCSLARAIYGRIMRCGIISSCQSAATSKTVICKPLLSMRSSWSSAISSTGPLPLITRSGLVRVLESLTVEKTAVVDIPVYLCVIGFRQVNVSTVTRYLGATATCADLTSVKDPKWPTSVVIPVHLTCPLNQLPRVKHLDCLLDEMELTAWLFC